MAKKARDRKRQTKINFSPAAKSSPGAATGATSSKEISSTRASRSKTTAKSRSSSSKAPPPPSSDSSSEDELAREVHRGMTLGMPVRSTQNGTFGESESVATADTSEDEDRGDNVQVKARVRSQKRRRVEASSESDETSKITIVKSRKRRRDTTSSASDDDTPKVKVVQKKRRKRHSPEAGPSDPEDEELRVPRRKQKKTTKSSAEDELHPARGKQNKSAQRNPAQDDESDDDSDMVEVLPARSRGRKAARKQPEVVEEEDEAPSRSKRRRIRKRAATPSESEDNEEDEEEEEEAEGDGDNANDMDRNDGDEQDDLREDLAFLRSSPLHDRGKLRSAHEKPKSDRQKALEALKKRRAGTSEPPSSATPARGRRVVIESDSGSDSELEIIKEERESDEEIVSDPEEEDEELSDRDANALDMFLEDEDDENFIDNDADAVIGEPILGPDDVMPLVFSRLSSSKPKELFKYAIEWMVMKKIYPGFDSRSEIYRLTFQKLDDEVKGLANSKFSSSAWTSDFTRALRARPDLTMMEISRQRSEIMDAHCEACNRRNHPASEELLFTGQPYHAETLEPLDNDSDSDSNKDSDNNSELSADSDTGLNGEKPTYDAQGSRIPPESKTFCLGRTCKANAQVAHTLHHWRYHLYSWVKDHLAREGHVTAEKLVQRDSWTDKKREKAALKIVKKMEENGEIRKLYHLYKDQITYATEAKHDGRYQRFQEHD